jgi:hypothetical protein
MILSDPARAVPPFAMSAYLTAEVVDDVPTAVRAAVSVVLP